MKPAVNQQDERPDCLPRSKPSAASAGRALEQSCHGRDQSRKASEGAARQGTGGTGAPAASGQTHQPPPLPGGPGQAGP